MTSLFVRLEGELVTSILEVLFDSQYNGVQRILRIFAMFLEVLLSLFFSRFVCTVGSLNGVLFLFFAV